MDANKSLLDVENITKSQVLESKVEFQGQVITLSELKSIIKEDTLRTILDKHIDQKFCRHVKANTVYKLDRFCKPDYPPSIINQTLVVKRKLNPKIFQKKCEDIFVFDGISYAELCAIVKPEPVDVSASLLLQQNIRFYSLRNTAKFHNLLKMAKHPIHRIQYDANSTTFYWISTQGSVKLIRTFLLDTLQEISPSYLVQTDLSKYNNMPILICGEPKIGKSLLLSEIARQVKQFCLERQVIFLGFINIVEALEGSNDKINTALVKQILASSKSRNNLCKAIFIELMNNENVTFDIFVDDFFDIHDSKIRENVVEYFRFLLEIKNMRLFITSSIKLQYKLEDVFGVGALKLTSENYLCTIWKQNPSIQKPDVLPILAKSVMRYYPDVRAGEIKYIPDADVPLKCVLLANAYLPDVIRICKMDDPACIINNSSKTIFQLYTRFMDFHFQRTTEQDLALQAHWIETFNLLYDHDPIVFFIKQALLKKFDDKSLFQQKLAVVGIMYGQQSPDKRPVFLHISIAEYLLAMFVSQNLVHQELVCSNVWHKFVYEKVLPLCESSGKTTFFGYILMEYLKNVKKSSKVHAALKNVEGIKIVLTEHFNITKLRQIFDTILQPSFGNKEEDHQEEDHVIPNSVAILANESNSPFSSCDEQNSLQSFSIDRQESTSHSSDSLQPMGNIGFEVEEQPVALQDLRIKCSKSEVLGLGSGGTIVYKGTYGNQEVAVKTLSTYKNPKQVDNEIKILLRCSNHPNIVRYIAYENLHTEILIALELCEKSTLDDWVVDKSCIPAKLEQMEVLEQITKGLCYLHENDVIHRDLKPKNILFSVGCREVLVKIADFGISREVNEGQSSIEVSRIGGSVGWKAAELIDPLVAMEPGETPSTILKSRKRNDIFSLGCIFYFVLTNGKHPFGATTYTREANIVKGETKFQENYHVLSEGRMLNLIKNMVSKKPGDRPGASAILADLLIVESIENT